MCNDVIGTKGDGSLRCVDILYSDQENKSNGKSAVISLEQKEMVLLDLTVSLIKNVPSPKHEIYINSVH